MPDHRFGYAGPGYYYDLGDGFSQREILWTLCPLEVRVPGVKVRSQHLRESFWRSARKAAERLPNEGGLSTRTKIRLTVPIHAAELLDIQLNKLGIDPHDYQELAPWPVSALGERYLSEIESHASPLEESNDWLYLHRALMVDVGNRMAQDLVEADLLLPEWASKLAAHQHAGLAKSAAAPWSLWQIPAGRGKTLGGLLTALAWLYPRKGDILVIGPAEARRAWLQQVPRYTEALTAHELTPESARRKGWVPFSEHVASEHALGRPVMLVAGKESLPSYHNDVRAVRDFQPIVLILDEVHRMGDRKRWSQVPEADGSKSFAHRLSKAGKKVKQCVSLMEASQMPSIEHRTGLSATSMGAGRPRRLYAMLDLLDPHGMGSYWTGFAPRYCNARQGDFGMLDDGKGNLDELRKRLNYYLFEATKEETSEGLDPVRVDVIWLEQRDQDKPTSVLRILQAAGHVGSEPTTKTKQKAQAKAITRLQEEDFIDAEDDAVDPKKIVIEALLANAASRKTTYVVRRAVEEATAGGKVVVFTARRRHCELLRDKITAAIRRTYQGDLALSSSEPLLLWAHGGKTRREREDVIDEYINHEGGAVLVATGQALGTSYDGMQCSSLGLLAQLPWNPDALEQWLGRLDRYGGVSGLWEVICARDSYDERQVIKLSDKIEGVKSLLTVEELSAVGDDLLGLPTLEEVGDSVYSMIVGMITA
jgi:hypothetical protein